MYKIFFFLQGGILLACILIATAFVGDILVILRSVNIQDKSISIGLWMTFLAILANVLGKFLYDMVARLTCQYWGTTRTLCHLHDGFKLGNYLCYVTGGLLVLCVIIKICAWFFCRDLKLYVPKEEKASAVTELKELTRNPDAASEQPKEQVETIHDSKL